MTDIELVKQFSGREPQFVYTFPQFLVYNVGGWDGLVKVDNETKKCSTFMPFDYPMELIKQYFKDPEPIDDVTHAEAMDDVYCALFEDDNSIAHNDDSIAHDDVYQVLFGVDDAIMDHLEHHGIIGMKWGIRRFQNPDGTRTAAGKARYNEGGPVNPIKKIGDAMKQHKVNKQRKAALEKARVAKAEKANHEADKQKALESGDYKQIQKYAHEISTKELSDALNRADKLRELDRKVVDTTPKEKDIWDKIDDAANKLNTVKNVADKGMNAWNTFAKAWNTFADEDSMLPELGTNFAEQQEKRAKERREAERKEKVEKISKTVDPEKIMKNQALFTDSELKSAKERVGNYEGLKLQKQLRDEGADSLNTNNKKKKDSDSNKSSDSDDKKKTSSSDLYDELEERETKLIEKQRETDKENESKAAAKRAADQEKAHQEFQRNFQEAKAKTQEALDDAVKWSQRSVYDAYNAIDDPRFKHFENYWDF